MGLPAGVKWAMKADHNWTDKVTSEGLPASEGNDEYQIIWPKPGLRAKDILALKIIPRKYDPSPNNPYALCTDRQVICHNRYHWEVQVRYSTTVPMRKELPANPLARPALITVRYATRRVPYLIDADGKPVANTAGDPFIGAERDVDEPVFYVTKNLGAYPIWLQTYTNSVNSDAVFINGLTYEPRTLKIGAMEIDPEETADRIYFVVRFQLASRFETWDDVFPNRGRRELVVPTITAANRASMTAAEIKLLQLPQLKDILVGSPARITSEDVWLDKNGQAYRDAAGNVRTTGLKPSELLTVRRKPLAAKPYSILPLT